ncbi:Cytochrome P450 [Pseudocercospora fuligena]|uniref:Cytochrome P450 n=1 Tax=Pseudocercospora fuligena TaxID=685502 RepID=A0A8H6VH01_9PEZI|nr:Cytochrome P450 [Pseudocercospora fuligena]
MSWFWVFAISISVCALGYYFVESSRRKSLHSMIFQRDGCKPLRCLPNKWFPPLGLDKLGNVIEAEKTKTYPLLMLKEHEKHGDTYSQWSGPLYTVITRDTNNIRAMLHTQFNSFEVGSGRHGCVLPLLGDGIFTQDGPKWKASRKLLAPMVQRPILPDLSLIERHFQQLLLTLKFDSCANQVVDIKQHFLELSLKLTTEFMLGENSESSSEWIDKLALHFNTALQWVSKRERMKAFYWMVDGLEFRRSCKASKNLIDDLIRQAIKHRQSEKFNGAETESYVAFETLLRRERDPGPIRSQFMNFLLAGRDSTGALLSWIFYALAREPGLQIKLRKEIENMLGSDGSRTPTKPELNSMTLLDQFVSETLRLFPPVPLNGRFCIEDTSLPTGGGENGDAPILIPRGTLLAFSTFAVQHNKDLYGQDASKFRPARWEDRSTKKRRTDDWSYHPFLGGPRKCLGERFAVTQAKYLTCRMLQHYKAILPVDKEGHEVKFKPDGAWVEDVKYDVGLTMMPDAGVWLRLVPQS